MNSALLLCTIAASALADPNGFYHQEYNYRTSSSSYKNHELQHKNDDEGYYSKNGDLEGRVKPQVNAHSQHSEYVNPKLQNAYRMGTDRTDSYGQLHAQNRFQMGEDAYRGQAMIGDAAYRQAVGNAGYNQQAIGDVGYNRQAMGGAYGLDQQQIYGVNSDLRQVTASLKAEMEREVQRAVFDHHQRAVAYGGVVNQAQIETDRRILEEELRRNMTMRLQDALKTQYGNQGVRGAYSYSITNGRLQPTANYDNQELEDLRRQMEAQLLRHLNQQVQTHYQTRVDTQVHTQRNTYRQTNGGHDNYPSALQQRPMVYPYNQPQTQRIEPYPQPMQPHHPVAPVPDSITTVATRVQTELNEILNKILEDTQRRYFSENSYNSGVNYESVLAQLQEELRTNITFHFDDQIKRAYGYSNYASKYNVEDIENLRRQIETNLITKLNRDFVKQREKFVQGRRMYVAQPVIPGNQEYYPVRTNMHYNQRDISEMQRQLQEQMSRQLQTALTQQSYRQANMYRNTGSQGVNAQAQYQATLDQLTAELNSNLTRQMELLNVQYQGGVHSDAQLAQMRNQLQHDLTRQLQQGLQQSYSRYSSWSSSSSSRASSNANYGQVKGGDAHYGVYGGSSDVMGEDCMMGDDPSAYQQQDEDLTQQTESLDQDLTQQTQTHDDLTQQTQTHDDLTQQVEDQDPTEQLDDQDLTQQTQDNADFTQQVQTHDDLRRQRPDGSDLTQQVQTHDDLTQQTRDDLTQQVQTHDDLTQQVQTHDDPTQQTRDDLTQKVQKHDDLTQQTQDALTQAPTRENSPQRPRWRPQQTQIYRQSPYSRGVPSQNQNLFGQSQSQDLSQQTQTHDDLTQQVQTLDNQNQFYRQPLTQPQQPIVVEPPYTSRSVNQLYTYQSPRQELTSVNQPPVSQAIGQGPVRYQGYRPPFFFQTFDSSHQPTVTQTSPDVYQQRRYQPTRYESPSEYTSTYEWRPQVRNPPGARVNQAVQHYEDLERQRSGQNQQILLKPNVVSPYAQHTDLGQQTYGSSSVQRQDVLGQQTENEDLTQQIQGQQRQPLVSPYAQHRDLGQQTYGSGAVQRQDVLGQQTENDDLTQQIQGERRQPIGQQHVVDQSQDMTQQTQDNQDTEFAPLQIGNNIRDHENDNFHYRRYSQTQRPTQVVSQNVQNINQPNQQTHDLTQQTEDLTRSQDLSQQNEGLTQQTQDLTRQNQDIARSNQYLSQQSQDLTNQNQDLTQQTEDLGQQFDDLTPQSHQFHHLTRPEPIPARQNQNLRLPNQQSQDLSQQTQDLNQQTDDLTQHNQDLRTHNHVVEPNQDLTQQTEDLTQQFQDLSHPSPAIAQQSQDLRRADQYRQSNQDVTQQTEDLTQQFPDLSQQSHDLNPPSQRLRRPNQYQNPQDQDLTQQSQDIDRDNQDLTQQTEDLTQQSEDLTQQSQDLTQQSQDLTQENQEAQRSTNKIAQDQRNQHISQQTQDLIQQEINQNQHFYASPDTTFRPQDVEQNTDIQQTNQDDVDDAERESQRLIDLLRRNRQNQQQSQNYSPADTARPGYNSQPIHSGVYEQKQGPGGRSLISPPTQVNYGTVEDPEKVETIRDIEPIEPQVANEVQAVGGAEAPVEAGDPDVTTKKPGWWSRLGQNIKNKIG